MFFYRNKHIMIDLGTGNNNKITWPFHDKQVIRNIVSIWITNRVPSSPIMQEFIDVVETVYRGARKGTLYVAWPCGPSLHVAWLSLSTAAHRLPPWAQRYAALRNRRAITPSLLLLKCFALFLGRGLVVSPKDYSTKYKY
jgi:hypothetical protein